MRDRHPPEVVEEARQRAKDKPTSEVSKNGENHMFAEVFVRDAGKSITVLEELFATGDFNKEADIRTYTIYMHGIKSALANVGRMDLSATALKLEQAGIMNSTDEIRAETPAFLEALRDCVELLKPKEEHSTEESTEEEKEYLKEKLLIINAACEEFNDDTAEEALKELKQKTWPKQTKELLDNISQKLLHSDYDEIVSDIKLFLETY